MAADIFFTDVRAWSASSAFFEDVITRAIGKCRKEESEVVRVLSNAEVIRRLDIDLQQDPNRQIALTERVLMAAEEYLQELRGIPGTHPADLSSLEELIAAAKAHLAELTKPG